MFGSTTLEIIIGIIIVFILVSTICSAIREGIESILKSRAAYLEQGIRQLLNDPDGTALAKNLYEHPLIYGLFNGSYKGGSNNGAAKIFARGRNLPHYIPSKNFARALMDIAARGTSLTTDNTSASTTKLTIENMRANIGNLNNERVQRLLFSLIDLAQEDLEKVQANIENWFNSGMDRVSGWYKHSTQLIIFGIALSVTIAMNVDTIKIIKYLSKNPTARELIVKEAEALNATGKINDTDAKAILKQLDFPIGWENSKIDPSLKIDYEMLLGWLITALAATLGAPYWFDILNKVMVIRATVKPHEKSLEEGSQDAQPKTPQVIYVSPAQVSNPAAADAHHIHEDSENDGCDIEFNEETADENLPESKGGTE